MFDAYKDEHLLNSLREECAQADKPFMSFDLSKDSPEGITFNSELAILDQQGGGIFVIGTDDENSEIVAIQKELLTTLISEARPSNWRELDQRKITILTNKIGYLATPKLMGMFGLLRDQKIRMIVTQHTPADLNVCSDELGYDAQRAINENCRDKLIMMQTSREFSEEVSSWTGKIEGGENLFAPDVFLNLPIGSAVLFSDSTPQLVKFIND